MSRLGCAFLSFDEYLRRRDPFSSRFLEVVITHEHDLSFVEICNLVFRWQNELRIYLSCIANDVKTFETEEGTLFRVSVPSALLNDNEKIWLKNYLDAIFSGTPTQVVEKVSGWYGLSEGVIKLTIYVAPQIECSLDFEPHGGDNCEVIFSANARYHYFLSGEEIKEEIDSSFYDDVKEAFNEFARAHEGLTFELNDSGFISNEELYMSESSISSRQV